MRAGCWRWVVAGCLLAAGGRPAAAQAPARPAADPLADVLGPDPLLDRPLAPPPGPFAGAEIAVLGVHLRNQLRETVTAGPRTDVFNEATVPGSPLGATVSPRFEVGYRLPDGAGEVGLAYRFLTTSGGGVAATPLGTADQTGRLNLNVADLAYSQRDFSLGPYPGYRWVFRWTLGVRLAEVDFDNRLQYRAGPVAGQRTTNNFTGAGPVAGLTLERRLPQLLQGLSFGVRLQGSDSFGQINQRYYETLAGGAGGMTAQRFQVGVVMAAARVGFSYEPTGSPARVYVGYQYESWFDVGRLNDARAQLDTQGIVLQFQYDF